MLTEVTERALAHTEKPDVLLTGGVSPNRRLQEMLKYISEEHDAKFYAVASPALAGDNGAMIAWTGILAYKSGQILEVEKSYVIPHWRMDQVEINWVPDE